jgi:HAD superfamily hydrolase (TIGR01484 family)
VVFGSRLVSGLHVKERQVGVHQLFVRLKAFGFVAFGDSGGVISFAIKCHAQCELGLEVIRLFRQNSPELRDGVVVLASAEVEHRVIVSILKCRHKLTSEPKVSSYSCASEANRWPMPIKLISTDFDGTLFAEFESPPIPRDLSRLIACLQADGAKWVINTGREMSSLMETLARANISVEPDYLVVVEREIHLHHNSQYIGLDEWNSTCTSTHADLFALVQPALPRVIAWIHERFHASIYEDAYSPLCLVARDNEQMDAIHDYLNAFCRTIPNLTVVRNDVYARFSHRAFNKGSALGEITRRLGLRRTEVFAIGDHLNDLPMLSSEYAAFLGAPSNAVPSVKDAVRQVGGYVSSRAHGNGVAEAIKYYLERFAG